MAKIIAMVGVFILPFVATFLPYKVSDLFARKGEKGKAVLSGLICFGGGVFFATFILHMAPEARAILDVALMKPYNIQYPVADLIMAGGFFLVFFMEKIFLKLHKRKQMKKLKRKREQCRLINKMALPDPSTLSKVEAQAESLKDKNEQNCDCSCEGNQERNGAAAEIVTVIPQGANKPPHIIVPNSSECPLLGTGQCCEDPIEITIQNTEDDLEKVVGDPENAPEEEDVVYSHNTRSLVLIVALSLHRIFEGTSIGLQHSASAMWHLFVAVMCHEVVIGFSLGLQFVKNEFSLRRMLVACILCSAIMPVGVAVGTVLIEVGDQDQGFDLVNGVLQAIATGTFIYVTFFEILQEEIDPHDTDLSKVIWVFVGFVVMAGLSAVPEDMTVSGTSGIEHVDNGFNANVTSEILYSTAIPGNP